MVVVTASATTARAAKNAVDFDANAASTTGGGGGGAAVLLAFGVGFSFQLGLDHDSTNTDNNGRVVDAMGALNLEPGSATTVAATGGIAGMRQNEKQKKSWKNAHLSIQQTTDRVVVV